MTKKICLIFKIFLVTSAQHLFLVCTQVSIRIYNEYVRQILQLEQIFYFDIFFLQSFAKFDRASAILQCHMWHGVLQKWKKKVQIKCSIYKFLKSSQHVQKALCCDFSKLGFFSEFSLQIFLWTFLDNREYNAISFILSCFSAKLFQFTMKSDLESSSCNNKIKGLSL